MDIATIIGVVAGTGLVIGSILLKTSIMAFIDVASLLIVGGGTLAATLNSFPLSSVIGALKTSIRILFAHRIDFVKTLQEMFQVATLARKEGPLGLEKHETSDAFLKKGLGLVADGTKGPAIKSIMEMERDAIEGRHGESQLILEKMGDLAPAWGMIGTLIGLVIMLLNLDDPSSIGPSMAVALLTTFYGALWANFMLIPAANKLEQRTNKEMIDNTIKITALVSIAENENPRILQEGLLGMLPPKDRQAAVPVKDNGK